VLKLFSSAAHVSCVMCHVSCVMCIAIRASTACRSAHSTTTELTSHLKKVANGAISKAIGNVISHISLLKINALFCDWPFWRFEPMTCGFESKCSTTISQHLTFYLTTQLGVSQFKSYYTVRIEN